MLQARIGSSPLDDAGAKYNQMCKKEWLFLYVIFILIPSNFL